MDVVKETKKGFRERFESFIERFGWSGSTLKLIAIVSMLIDHVGVAIVGRMMNSPSFTGNPVVLSRLYSLMRNVGRLAFPIYCFLLVEGFLHTRNAWKYFAGLCIFGIISEVPFDLCFYGCAFYTDYQNVFFTLALGVLLLKLIEWIMNIKIIRNSGIIDVIVKCGFGLVALILVGAFSIILKCDYNMPGLCIILMLYLLRTTKLRQLLAMGWSALFILEEPVALFCMIPTIMYNGKRGLKLKYFFYAFYPVHLLILWLVAVLMGI